ncbi:MAG: hypothetical protein ACYDH9_13045, partial [Limisphaerales bacterium]
MKKLARKFAELLVFLLFLAPLGIWLRADAPPPALAAVQTNAFVWTDRPDYPPGDTAQIYGRNFQPGETVTLLVVHADGTPDSGAEHEPWTMVIAGDGTFESTWHVCEDDCVGSTLLLSATGGSSGAAAQVLFTDGTASPITPSASLTLAWGYNGDGELGNGTFANSSTPVAVNALPGGRRMISVVGGLHSLALADDGTIWAWGWGYFGPLGNGTFASSSTPVAVNALLGGRHATAIGAGRVHSLALADDGTMWAWGYGYYGQLGDGAFHTSNPYGSSIPVQVIGLPGGRKSVAIAGGGYHSLALADDGTMWAWGLGSEGQLGDGTFRTSSPYGSSIPVQVIGLPGGRKSVAIAGGGYHSLAL